MITISLCMIVKDEEKVLTRCLECVKDCVDEIIIVDTGSVDKTIQIADKFNAKVFSFEWIDDFSEARNFSFSKATKEYTMWLDADDILSIEDKEKLIDLKRWLNPNVDVVMMPYHVQIEGAVVCFRERLLKTSQHFKWVEPVHEAILPKGNIYFTDIVIMHAKIQPALSQRNLEIYERYLNKGNLLSCRGKLYYGKELYEHGKYAEAKKWLVDFLHEEQDAGTDTILACRILSKCYKQVGEKDNSISILYMTFKYDAPQHAVCCDIGDIYLEEQAYKKAMFWYELALKIPRPEQEMGIVEEGYFYKIPKSRLKECYLGIEMKIGNRRSKNEVKQNDKNTRREYLK